MRLLRLFVDSLVYVCVVVCVLRLIGLRVAFTHTRWLRFWRLRLRFTLFTALFDYAFYVTLLILVLITRLRVLFVVWLIVTLLRCLFVYVCVYVCLHCLFALIVVDLPFTTFAFIAAVCSYARAFICYVVTLLRLRCTLLPDLFVAFCYGCLRCVYVDLLR